MKKVLYTLLAAILGLSLMVSFAGCGGPGVSESVAKAKEMDPDKFKSGCEAVEYREIKKNPDAYVDKQIKVEVNIVQDLDNGYFRAYTGNPGDEAEDWCEDELLLLDASDKGLDLAEGDTATVYGVYTGLSEVERAMYDSSEEIPEVAAIQKGKVESDEAINKMLDSINFKKSTDEWGDVTFTAEVENTTGIEFGTLEIDINCLSSKGSNVGSDVCFVENWKPNKMATIKFEFLPEETDRIEITDTYRYSD